jgi:hypothetical protein
LRAVGTVTTRCTAWTHRPCQTQVFDLPLVQVEEWRVGSPEALTESGEYRLLRKKYGMDAAAVMRAVEELM